MFDLKDMTLDELYDMKRNMEEDIENYIGDDRGSFHTGDQGYQDKLMDLYDVEEEIEKRENSPKSNENKMNNLMNYDEYSLNEKKKPSAGLTKKEKSAIVKKAKKGKNIGKGHFKDVVAKAKKYGAKDPDSVAAAAMWKNIKK